MKKLIILLIAGFAGLTQAQQVTLSTPINVYNSVTTNLASPVVIDCRRQQNVTVEWTTTLGGAGSSVGGITFIPSVDGSTVASSAHNNGFFMAIAANGTTAVVVSTNFNVKGIPYLVGNYITNGNAQIMTNTFKYWVKPNAP